MNTVETVLGPINTTELGFSLMHEHALISGENDDKVFSRTRLALMQLKHNYIKSFVDATPIDCRRDPTGLVSLAQESGMNILASTGHFDTDQAGTKGVTRLVDLFVRDLSEGMGNSGAKASFIRTGVGKAGLTDAAMRHHTAAAIASNISGAPIMLRTAHTMRHAGAQVDHLLNEGVPQERIRVEHSLLMESEVAAAIAKRGVWLVADRFCLDCEVRLARFTCLLQAGYADRLLLSLDLSTVESDDSGNIPKQNDVPYGWLHLKLDVIKKLNDRGIDGDLLYRIAIENPKRFFNNCQRN
jgi:phosphotriesterase-related protein